MAVDIVIQETIDSVDITVNPNIIEVNVTRTSGGGGGIPTLQEVLDNNHDLVDGNFFAGTGAGDTNTGTSVIGIGESAASGNSGIHINAFGEVAGLGNSGSEVNALGPLAGEFNTGNSVNAFGNGTGLGNSGNNVNAFGSGAGGDNTFNNVNLFGENATADENGQTVLSKDGTIMARISTTDLTESRKYTLQDADGTLAFLSDITGGGVTQTSQLTNDGSDGVNPFITALDIPTTGQASTLVREVKNMTGATLTKGTVVYISGANGNKALVSKAIATTDGLSARTFGLLQSDILNNGLGNCVIIGDLSGVNTSSFAEGAQLYLSGVTAGTFTDTRVLAPTHLVYVGKVTRSHPTQGQIEVGIQNGYELAEIHDVSITSVTNNQLLAYTSATDLWQNKNLIDILKDFNKTKGIYFFEEFMGNQGGSILTSFGGVISNTSGAGANCISTSATFPIINRTNQQGVVRAQTGTTNTGYAGFTYSGPNLFRGTGAISLETYVTVETLSTSTDRFHTIFGYLGVFNVNNPPNGIFFAYDEGGAISFGSGNAPSPNWKCVAINTSTRTFFTSSIPVVAGQWYKLRIDLNAAGTEASYYIDGNLIGILTTNIPAPTTGMSINNLIVKTIGTTTRAIQNDYFMYEEIFTTAR